MTGTEVLILVVAPFFIGALIGSAMYLIVSRF